MKIDTLKFKIVIFLVLLISFLFFSNNFNKVDIEKTAIITAVAIDIENGEYKITAQVAVPEATDANTENSKAEIYGKGKTVGDAIKDIGDTSGWFPQLSFCNLIILGNDTKDMNCMKFLDYFANTLRVQDSAVVVLAEKKAAELLEVSTPLDHISSFALQKILLKNPGLDNDTANNDIKDFTTSYYADASSSFMPLVKVLDIKKPNDSGSSQGGQNDSQQESGGSGGGSSSGQDGKGKNIFDTRTTALYKNGKNVGELNPDQTLAFNLIVKDLKDTTFEVENVIIAPDSDQNGDYLLTTQNKNAKIKVTATPSEVIVDIKVKMQCKITSQNTNTSDATSSKSIPLPKPVVEKAQEKFTKLLNELVEVSKQTECDFLNIQQKIYQRNHKYYNLYKNGFYKNLRANVSVEISGQK